MIWFSLGINIELKLLWMMKNAQILHVEKIHQQAIGADFRDDTLR
jgi:hypothetical protein